MTLIERGVEGIEVQEKPKEKLILPFEGKLFDDDTMISSKGYQELLRRAAAFSSYYRDVFIDPDALLGKSNRTEIKVDIDLRDIYFTKVLDCGPREWKSVPEAAFWAAVKEFSGVQGCVDRIDKVRSGSSIDLEYACHLFDRFRLSNNSFNLRGSTGESLSDYKKKNPVLSIKAETLSDFIAAIEKSYSQPGKLLQRRVKGTFTYKIARYKQDDVLFTVRIRERTVNDSGISNYDTDPLGVFVELPEAA